MPGKKKLRCKERIIYVRYAERKKENRLYGKKELRCKESRNYAARQEETTLQEKKKLRCKERRNYAAVEYHDACANFLRSCAQLTAHMMLNLGETGFLPLNIMHIFTGSFPSELFQYSSHFNGTVAWAGFLNIPSSLVSRFRIKIFVVLDVNSPRYAQVYVTRLIFNRDFS